MTSTFSTLFFSKATFNGLANRNALDIRLTSPAFQAQQDSKKLQMNKYKSKNKYAFSNTHNCRTRACHKRLKSTVTQPIRLCTGSPQIEKSHQVSQPLTKISISFNSTHKHTRAPKPEQRQAAPRKRLFVSDMDDFSDSVFWTGLEKRPHSLFKGIKFEFNLISCQTRTPTTSSLSNPPRPVPTKRVKFPSWSMTTSPKKLVPGANSRINLNWELKAAPGWSTRSETASKRTGTRIRAICAFICRARGSQRARNWPHFWKTKI